MKKLLACLSAVVLLVSVLLVGIVPAAAGDDVTGPLLADYTTQANYDAAVSGGKLSTSGPEKAVLSFDATLGAAKVTYANPSGGSRADEAWIYVDPVNEIAVAGNEVIVAKVKAPAGLNAQGFLTYSHKAMAGDKGVSYKNTVDNNGNHWYTKDGAPDVLAGKDGWLYVAYTSKATVESAGVAADAKWGRVQVIGHGSFYKKDDALSIAWVGAFASLEAAKAWDEGAAAPSTTPSTKPTEPAGLPKAEGASDYFFDFTQGVNTTPGDTALYVGIEGNTSMSYNADVKAMEIATKAGDTSDVNMAKFQFFNGDGIPAATEPVVSEYPYFAMKLKLATTDITPGTSIITRNDKKNAWVSLPVKYEMTTDWQLVMVDASAVTDPSVWWLNIFNLIANKPANAALYDGTAETIGFVQWAGAFDSKEAAEAYFDATTDTTPSTTPSSGATTTTTTKPTLEVNKGTNFYFDFSTEEGYKLSSSWGNYRGQLNNAKGENSFNLDSTKWREASNLAYDAEVGGTKIVKKDDSTSPIEMVLYKRAEGLDAEYPDEYPVVGIKVKMNKKAQPGLFGYSAAIGGTWQWPWSISGYTGEWQLITFTVDNYKSTVNDKSWRGLIGQLVKNPQDFANDEVIGHLAWGGVFVSEEDAMNHFYNTTPEATPSTTPSSGEGEGTTTTTRPTVAVNKGEKFYFDFSTEEGYKTVSGWTPYRSHIGNAKGEDTFNLGANKYREASNLSYDAELQAARIIKADGNNDKALELVMMKTQELVNEYPDEYPVVGIKIKMNKKAKPGSFGYCQAIGGQWTLPWSASPYTGEWQLITFAVSNYNSTVADKSWRGIIGQIVKNPQDFADNEVIGHIAWGGVFASEDDAMNHFLNTTPDYVAPEAPEDDGTPFLVDLTTKEKYDSAVDAGLIFTNNSDNASLEYSENIGAAVFTYLNGKPISDARRGEAGFCFRAGKDLKVADGKVIVVKLRYSSANYLTYSHKAMIKGGATIQYTNGTNGNFEYAANNPSMLKGDGEWVYCAYTDPDMVDTASPKPGANSVWQGLDITAHGSFYQEGDTVTVAWVGAFESIEAAKEYDQGSTGGTTKPTTKPTQPPAGSEDPVDRPFFVDLSTQNKYNKANGSTFKANGDANVKVEYDATVGGVKVMTATDTPANIGSVVFFNRDTGTTYEDYPYFVMKVKLADGKGKMMAPAGGLFATMRYGAFRAGLKSMVSYQDTDDWQLLIYQAKESYHPEMKPENDWNAVISAMFNDGEPITAGETLGWIQWGGIFASVEEAYTFAGIDPEKAPTDLFWRFDSEDAVNKPVRGAGDTKIAYDEEFDAMKITATDTDGDKFVAFTPGRIVLGAKQQIKGDYDVNEYPYVAFRVRVANKLQDGGGIYVRSTGSLDSARQGVIDSADMLIDTVNYENISNWQTIVIRWDEDPMVKFFFSGNWKQIQFNAFSEAIGAAKEGDTAWVRWAGAFKSLEDIEAYVATTAAYEIGDTSDGAIPEPDPTQPTQSTTTTTTTTTTTEETTTTTEITTEATTVTTEETTEATTTTTEVVEEEEEEEIVEEEEEVEEEEIVEEEKVYIVVNVPFEGDNGNFIIGEYDTGIPYDPEAEFYVDEETGHWFINGVDTGIPAEFEEYVEEEEEEVEEEVPSEEENTPPPMGENTLPAIMIAVLAVMMGAAMVLFSKKNNVTE